jgi:hypothetical protein
MIATRKALVAGVAAALLLLMSAVTSANRLSFRNSLGTTAWRATWNEFGFTQASGSSCSLTLEGSLHSGTFVKTRSLLIGYVTSGSTGSCGPFLAATVLTTRVPWHLRYQSFSGALPNISNVSMQIIGFEYQIRETLSGITCLFRSTEEQPLSMDWNRAGTGSITAARIAGMITGCGRIATFAGRPASVTAATITLI